jgi:hypothetical protein
MKSIKNIMIWAIMPLMFLASCSQKDKVSLSEAGIPKIADINVSITVDSLNWVTFHIENKAIVPVWYFAEDDFFAQNDYKRKFDIPGTYSVDVKVYNKNGISDGSITKTFVIEKGPFVTYLTANSSKTWVWDHKVAGYLGCGPSGTTGLGWWSAGPGDQASTGLYDDEITFKVDKSYIYNPGADGKLYVNAGSGYKTEYKTGSGDYDVPVETLTSSYKFEQSGGSVYLDFPANTMVSYIPNPEALAKPRYKILNLTANVLELVVDNGGIAWHYRFIPK